jgi:hypothetical protein
MVKPGVRSNNTKCLELLLGLVVRDLGWVFLVLPSSLLEVYDVEVVLVCGDDIRSSRQTRAVSCAVGTEQIRPRDAVRTQLPTRRLRRHRPSAHPCRTRKLSVLPVIPPSLPGQYPVLVYSQNYIYPRAGGAVPNSPLWR